MQLNLQDFLSACHCEFSLPQLVFLMARTEYSGKRGGNAGDDFHEIWAMRRALEILAPRSTVQQVTVEGVLAEDEAGSDRAAWDGVDCAIYHGERDGPFNRIELVQLKYSGSEPSKPWSLARLTHSSRKSRNNSVVARLSEAYRAMATKYADLARDGKITVKLVSNQPASAELESLLALPPEDEKLALIRDATGLETTEFSPFWFALDLSELGTVGRHQLEEKLILEIAAWEPSDTARYVDKFRLFIQNRMKPEGEGAAITMESILGSVFNVGAQTLFPCPNEIEPLEHLVQRAAAREIIELWHAGIARVCLHGQGGEGKTTVLQDISSQLPSNSVMVVYDCYGAGSYLDSDGLRHKPSDAFRQMGNDASAELLLPLLVSQDRDADHARLFSVRLKKVAQTLATLDGNALLVVAVDAADNAVTAADQTAGTQSFVPAFLELGSQPPNVRFLVSARSGRLNQLALPREYKRVPLAGFTLEETFQFLNSRLAIVHDDDRIAPIHKLSGGNPRVLQYALKAADNDISRLLDFLAPNGKNLGGIFDEIIENAFKKVGADGDITRLCAGLTLLPRPVPINCLAAVCGFNEAHTRDILADLSPGVIVDGEYVGFRDEDFESHIRDHGATLSTEILEAAAIHLADISHKDAYAAEHVADILLRAGRLDEVLELAQQQMSDYPIDDPALRTIVYERRMRAAIRSCRQTGNVRDATTLLLTGADAFRKDAAIRELLFDNLDLAAYFSQEQMRHIFLADPTKRPRHGSFLMQSIAVSGESGNRLDYDDQNRLINAWLENFHEQRQNEERHRYGDRDWQLNAPDIAAWIYGVGSLEGWEVAHRVIMGARPISFRQNIRFALIEMLARKGKFEALEGYLSHLPDGFPGKGLAQALLALGGRAFDETELLADLERHAKTAAALAASPEQSYRDQETSLDILELWISAVEVALINGAPRARIRRILAPMCAKDIRSRVRFDRHVSVAANVTLRAFVLYQTLAGRMPRASDFVVVPFVRGRSKAAQRKRRERDEIVSKAVKRVERVLPAYHARAKVLRGSIETCDAVQVIRQSLELPAGIFDYDEERFDLRTRDHYLARSLLLLFAIEDIPSSDLFDATLSLFQNFEFPSRIAASQLLRFAQFFPRTHELVLDKIREVNFAWREEKIPSYDKIEGITRYSRIALMQNHKVAFEGFELAIEIASEIDAESVHALAICEQLSKHAQSQLGDEAALTLARDLGAITQDVGLRIGSNDGFPWRQIAAALAYLSPSQAFATCARFHEIGLTNLDELLEPILTACIKSRSLPLPYIAALLALLNGPSSRILDELTAPDIGITDQCLAVVAREALLRSEGSIPAISKRLGTRAANAGKVGCQLLETAAFLDGLRNADDIGSSVDSAGLSAQLTQLDWKKISSADDLAEALNSAISAAPEGSYLSWESLLSSSLHTLPEHRRVDILTYVTPDVERFGLTYQLGDFLFRWLDAWKETPGVVRWCRTHLLGVIVNNLPALSRYLEMGHSRLGSLIALADADGAAVIDALLTGIAHAIDELHSATIYFLAAEIATRGSAEECANALRDHISRRLVRLEPSDRMLPNMNRVPVDAQLGASQFVFALLGSPIVPLRWQAAHVVRRLALLEQARPLHHLFECYFEEGNPSFGHHLALPYILSSRLWLLVGIARAAWESPTQIMPLKDSLFAIGESASFPHVLIRSFAQLALRGLAQSNADQFSLLEMQRIEQINAPAKVSTKKKRQRNNSTFQKYEFGHTRNRKFRFDTLDTLPYRYNYAVRGFANPSAKKFLDRAEHWIIKEWASPECARDVDKLRRGSNLWRKDGFSTSTSHGSNPSIESYQTYLETHAMYCAVGDFLATEPLDKDADDWDCFEAWLKRQGLTMAPIWLSDLRLPKPLELQAWQEPTADADWLKKRDLQDYRRELGLEDKEWLVLASDHWSNSNALTTTVRVESCLVSGETATSLRRTLEAYPNSFSYRLAIDDDNEINHGDFILRAILRDCETETKLDEHDRFRGDLTQPSIVPRSWILELLGLSRCPEGYPIWLDQNGMVAIQDRAWSDDANYSNRPDYKYRVHGHRLLIRRDKLIELLNKTELDLAVELTMRRGIGKDYWRTGTKKAEIESDRILIFRRNGALEATGKRLGTWRADRAGT